GRRRFPKSPFFPHLLAVSFFEGEELRSVTPWTVRDLLDEAERLAKDLPHDERRERLLEDVADRRKILEAGNPVCALFGGGGGGCRQARSDFYDDSAEEGGDEGEPERGTPVPGSVHRGTVVPGSVKDPVSETAMTDPYAVLGLPPDSDDETIRRRYLEL